MGTGQTPDGQTDGYRTRLTLPVSVRFGAAALWIASAAWTTVSVHHVIKGWGISGVVTLIIESAYGLATIWFHTSRTRLSAAALVVALMPVVAALAYADKDMFGWVGLAFAFGPVIAEGGFLLAAHLGIDPAALTAEQQSELADIKRRAVHRAALRVAELEAELEGIRADAVRQMALDAGAAEVEIQRNDLSRKIAMSAPRSESDIRVRPVSAPAVRPELSAGQTDKPLPATGQTVSELVSEVVRPVSGGQEDTTDTDVRPAVSAPVRLSVVRPGGLSGAVRQVLSEDPEISNADLIRRVIEITGQDQKPDSVAKTRKRQQSQSA